MAVAASIISDVVVTGVMVVVREEGRGRRVEEEPRINGGGESEEVAFKLILFLFLLQFCALTRKWYRFFKHKLLLLVKWRLERFAHCPRLAMIS